MNYCARLFVIAFAFAAAVPPFFEDPTLKGDTNVTIREYDNVTLSCRADGNPKPEMYIAFELDFLLFPSVAIFKRILFLFSSRTVHGDEKVRVVVRKVR